MARLDGLKQITQYVNRSEPTVLGYIQQMDFPAVKLNGIWISDTDKIDSWYLAQIDNRDQDQTPSRPAEKNSALDPPPDSVKQKKTKKNKNQGQK